MKVKWFAHAGFRRKWRAVKDKVGQVTQDNINKIDRVIIASHSQGGGLAYLAHEYVKFNFPGLLVQTITFGAPRSVFFWNFRKIKDRFEGITSYRIYMDIVPHLPQKILGYKDIGDIVILGKKIFHMPFPPSVILRDHSTYGDYF